MDFSRQVVMPLEVIALNGKGAIEITGYLRCYEESARIAVSYMKCLCKI